MRLLSSFAAVLSVVFLVIIFFIYRKRDTVNLTETSIQILFTSFSLIIFSSFSGFFLIFNYYQLWSKLSIIFNETNFNLSFLSLSILSLLTLFLPLTSFLIFIITKHHMENYNFSKSTDCINSRIIIESVLKSVCCKMDINREPKIKFIQDEFASPRAIPNGTNNITLILPSNLLKSIDIIAKPFKNESLKANLLEYTIRHELAHLYNKDIFIYPLLRWFEKTGIIFIYLIIILFALYMISENGINIIISHYYFCISISLLIISFFYFVFIEVVERKRESLADIRAMINSSEELKSDLLLQKHIYSSFISPFESLATIFFFSNISMKFTKPSVGMKITDKIFYYLSFPVKFVIHNISLLIFPYKSPNKRWQEVVGEIKSPKNNILPTRDIAIWCGCIIVIAFFYFSFAFDTPLPSESILPLIARHILYFVTIPFLAVALLASTWANLSEHRTNLLTSNYIYQILLAFITSSLVALLLYYLLFTILYIATGNNYINGFWELAYQLLKGLASLAFLYSLGFTYIRVVYENANKLNKNEIRTFLYSILILILNITLLVFLFFNSNKDEFLFSVALYTPIGVIYLWKSIPNISFEIHEDVYFLKFYNFEIWHDSLKYKRFKNMSYLLAFQSILFIFVITIPLSVTSVIANHLLTLINDNLDISINNILLSFISLPLILMLSLLYKQRNQTPISFTDYLYYNFQISSLLNVSVSYKTKNIAKKHINSLKSATGGYQLFPSRSFTRLTRNRKPMSLYYKVFKILSQLGQNSFDKEWIHNLECTNGGFGYINPNFPRIESTYHALEIIDQLGVDTLNKQIHADWLIDCYRDYSFFSEYYNNNPTIKKIYYALSSLYLLGNLDRINNPNAITDTLNKLWQRGHQTEELAYYYIKSLSILNCLYPEIIKQIKTYWLPKTKHTLLNTKYNNHYMKFYFFIKLHEIIDFDMIDIRNAVTSELIKAKFIQQNPEAH